ncbi:MAG: hypothetical protein D3924_05515 [Candidatus Electrothrix sp. AR4]|nr:hypothetical protein [Candidatus Electrothrix sp. AR4]
MINLQLITILYDLALVTSGEIKASSLIQKTLQRILYHTSFPAGMYFSYQWKKIEEGNEYTEMEVESVIGNKKLRELVEKKVLLPSEVIVEKPTVMKDKSIVVSVLEGEIRYNVFLILPVKETGLFILMSKEMPEFQYPYEYIFTPVLQNFHNSLTLLRENEKLFIRVLKFWHFFRHKDK